MKRALRFAFLTALVVAPLRAQAPAANDGDHTLQAMKDEMARAKARLELAIPPSNQPTRSRG